MFYARFNSALTRLQERFVWHSRGQKPKKGKVGRVQAERCKKYENRTFQLQFSAAFARVSEIPSKNHVWASLGLLGPPDPLLGPPRFFLRTFSEPPRRNFLGPPRSSSELLGSPRFSPVLLSVFWSALGFLPRRASENASDGLSFGHFHLFAAFSPKLCHIHFLQPFRLFVSSFDFAVVHALRATAVLLGNSLGGTTVRLFQQVTA